MALTVRLTEMPKKIIAAGEGCEMIELLLNRVGLTGVWSVRPLNQIRWRDNERFRIIRFDQGRILVKMRPAGSDSAWEWQLTPPTVVGAGTAYTKLLDVDGWDGHTSELERKQRLNQVREQAAVAKTNGHAAVPKVPSIATRLADLQKDAERWANRAEDILVQEVALNERLEAIAKAEESLNALRSTHAADEDGKRAYDALQRLQQMLG